MEPHSRCMQHELSQLARYLCKHKHFPLLSEHLFTLTPGLHWNAALCWKSASTYRMIHKVHHQTFVYIQNHNCSQNDIIFEWKCEVNDESKQKDLVITAAFYGWDKFVWTKGRPVFNY